MKIKALKKRQKNKNDYWEISYIVSEPTGTGTESREYAYLINRSTGKIKKELVKIT